MESSPIEGGRLDLMTAALFYRRDVWLRSRTGEVDELSVFDLQDDGALDRVAGSLELHIACHPFIGGDGSQSIAHRLAIELASGLDGLEQQSEGIVRQSGNIIRCLIISALIGLDKGLRLGGSNICGIVRREIEALALVPAKRHQLDIAPR